MLLVYSHKYSVMGEKRIKKIIHSKDKHKQKHNYTLVSMSMCKFSGETRILKGWIALPTGGTFKAKEHFSVQVFILNSHISLITGTHNYT